MTLIHWSAELEFDQRTMRWVVTVYRNGHWDHDATFSYQHMARKYVAEVESWS